MQFPYGVFVKNVAETDFGIYSVKSPLMLDCVTPAMPLVAGVLQHSSPGQEDRSLPARVIQTQVPHNS